jgi:predicted DNA-binding protein (MmcQ/YjbR family)
MSGAMPRANRTVRAAAKAMREFAFGLPGAWEDNPWDESVAKVGKKIFVFNLVKPEDVDDTLLFTVKLPESSDAALTLRYTEPSGYGLGKAGWVTVRFEAGTEVEPPPVDLFLDWIEESYRAVAPKKLIAALDANPPDTARR